MKTCFRTICLLTLATSVSFSQEKPEGPGGPLRGKRPNPEAVFAKLDADANGSVTLEEFLKSPRAQKNPEKATEIFKKIDADSNEAISLEEFKAHRPPHGPRNGGKRKGDQAGPTPAE